MVLGKQCSAAAAWAAKDVVALPGAGRKLSAELATILMWGWGCCGGAASSWSLLRLLLDAFIDDLSVPAIQQSLVRGQSIHASRIAANK